MDNGETAVKLSLEQQFELQKFQMQANGLSREQAIKFLVNLREHLMVRENYYKELVKKQWQL